MTNSSSTSVAIAQLLRAQDARVREAAIRIAQVIHSVPPNPAYLPVTPRALIVGGFVRDTLLGFSSKDVDLEIYGLSPQQLAELVAHLFPTGSVNAVGKSFGVLKVHVGEDLEFDLAIPRRESKIGRGHTGFAIDSDPSLSVEHAARRRDFTLNALAIDPLTNELIDPTGGLADLQAKILRVVDATTFQDDPLRVYRAVQLVARFGFAIDEQTLELLHRMVESGDLDQLPSERLAEEWKKLLLKSPQPSRGFILLRELGIIEQYFPELHALISHPHSAKDSWQHTLQILDQAAHLIHEPTRSFSSAEKLQIMYGSLCYSLGPASTDQSIIKSFCARLGLSQSLTTAVITIAKNYLLPEQLFQQYHSRQSATAEYLNAVRKFVKQLHPLNWRVLLAVTEAATNASRASHDFAQTVTAHQLDLNPTQTLLQGRDLAQLGVTAGPDMGKIIQAIETLRDAGTITTKQQALQAARRLLA